jgi:hypothetical protein
LNAAFGYLLLRCITVWCVISVCIWVMYSTGNEFASSRLFDPSNFGGLDNYRLSTKYMCTKIQ